MFLEHYGLIEQPFGVTPDSRFLHLGPKHREALASLIYGTEANRGFLALIGPPGMGKTSLLFHYLESLRNQARTAFLFQTASDAHDLMRYLLADLGLDASGKDVPAMHEMLNQVLTEEMHAGRRMVLVIDEAQNLDEKVLESVRLLSNFETPWMKLMQIVIAGQPQLAERLTRPSMAQLRQRISTFVRLEPFTAQETNAYIDHRLWVAGYTGSPLFTVGARILIAKHSSGIPRNINNLCFHSMSLGCASGKKQVDSGMVREAISDLAIESIIPAPQPTSQERLNQAATSHVFLPTASAMERSWLTPPAKRSGRIIPATVSIWTVLFLGLVSGAFWKTALPHVTLDAQPSVETAVIPAPSAPLAQAPETPILGAPVSPAAASDSNYELFQAPSSAQITATPRILTVSVEKGATLRHMSLLYLDRFDLSTLAEIRSLNPAITDPNHLEAGQQLRLPLYIRPDTPRAVKPAASRPATMGFIVGTTARPYEDRP